jgi:hypothetical protein
MMPSNMISMMSIGSVSAVVLCLRSESRNLFRQSDLALHLIGNGFDLLLDVGRIGTLWGIMSHYILPPFSCHKLVVTWSGFAGGVHMSRN